MSLRQNAEDKNGENCHESRLEKPVHSQPEHASRVLSGSDYARLGREDHVFVAPHDHFARFWPRMGAEQTVGVRVAGSKEELEGQLGIREHQLLEVWFGADEVGDDVLVRQRKSLFSK